MPETISIERDGQIVTVSLLRPTMPPLVFEELATAFREIAADFEVRAVILRSNAKHFTYGLDLPAAFQDLGPAIQGGSARSKMELLSTIRRLQGYMDDVANCPVPVVAAVHGWCIGGGVDLICTADIRLASSDAKFSVRETKIAIVADLGSLQRLPPLIGQAHTRELALTGRDVPASRAEQIGLVTHVADSHEALLERARAVAEEIAQNPPLTVRGVKQVLGFGEGKPAAEGLKYVAAWNSAFLASEDLGEALSAFMEKRPPKYQGK